ncbi:hypothetical protein U9M48_011937 [Paspalum notatum var. saurae]|uniref:Uncharacterized protein n=1 Tax=Paspalum notatum var. saurae TaxID=547442 RepID=A0AAQ3SWI5_PASNO
MFDMSHAAFVGSALYFLIYAGILEYNLTSQSMSMVHIPPKSLNDPIVLITTGDGRLGFARVEDTKICFWLIETHPDGGAVLSHMRSIDLVTLLRIDASLIKDCFLSFAHGVGVIYVGTSRARFSIDLKSNQVREEERRAGWNFTVIPYMSFYTPDLHRYGVVPNQEYIGSSWRGKMEASSFCFATQSSTPAGVTSEVLMEP